MKLSLLIPFYNEEDQLAITLQTVRPILQSITEEYEIIAIDDGSKDKTWEILRAEAAADPHIHAIRFSRNFGKEAANCAALDHVQGDVAILMDGDLQHPPRYIPEMIRLWQEGYDIVDGVKSSRGKESPFYRFIANSFYSVFTKLSKVDMKDASDFKLLDRKVIDAWKMFDERNTFFRGIASWMGFKRTVMPFEVESRKHGESKWNLKGLWRLSTNAITSFSSVPLVLVSWVGIAFLFFAGILALISIIQFIRGTAVEGFTTVILLLLIIGGAILLSLGLIGTYISRIYDEVKARPRYLKMEELNTTPFSAPKEIDNPNEPPKDETPMV